MVAAEAAVQVVLEVQVEKVVLVDKVVTLVIQHPLEVQEPHMVSIIVPQVETVLLEELIQEVRRIIIILILVIDIKEVIPTVLVDGGLP